MIIRRRDSDAEIFEFVETTRVKFSNLSSEWIHEYIRTEEPMDKAGAYSIQGIGRVFVERIEGDYFNVVGLPIHRLVRLLREKLQNAQ